MKAALAFLVKEAIGNEEIETREDELLRRAFDCWNQNEQIEILGGPDPAGRTAIVSFNVRDPRGGHLHPKYLTVLLNDLFGIQSRAGCSCAGPYGHALLDIDQATSERYRAAVSDGWIGLKPGWCRVGFHYAMDDHEANFLIEAIDFVARRGWIFQQLYEFDMKAATWEHREFEDVEDHFDIETALNPKPIVDTIDDSDRIARYADFMRKAEELATELEATAPRDSRRLDGELGELQFFSY